MNLFQNPLTGGFARIPIRGFSRQESLQVLQDIDRAAGIQRKRWSNPGLFSSETDPVLEGIYKIMLKNRIHFVWDHIILLGCSAGGDETLRTLFSKITVPHIPIIVAMHHNPGFRFSSQFMMANEVFQHPILIQDGEAIHGSRIYFVPGEMILGFKKITNSFKISRCSRLPRFRPDIDQVFTAASDRYRQQLSAAILTGMLSDGAQGAKALVLNGGQLWIQDPDTAIFRDMPQAALKTVPRARRLTLDQMAMQINEMTIRHLTVEPMGLFGESA